MERAIGNYPWRWRIENLLRGLRTERSCSADVLKECWLIEHLSAWNRVLRTVQLVLTEFEPGKLSLRSREDADGYVAWYRGAGSEDDGALLMAWLPRLHHCICEVRVHYRPHIGRLSVMSSVIVAPASNLYRVVLHPGLSLQPGSEFLEAFGPPKCLCVLDLTNVCISDALALKVAEVLRRNGPTLHTVKLIGNELSPGPAGTLLRALVDCERLENLTFQDSAESSACSAMTQTFRSTRVLQKLSLVRLCEAGIGCQHSVYSLTSAPEVCLRCSTDLFAALEGVPSFQHLTLQRTYIGDTMGKALAQFLTGHHPLQTLSLLNCGFGNRGAAHIAKALHANCTLRHFKLQKCFLQTEDISKFCSILPTNTTLKSLVLPKISSTSGFIQREISTLKLECPGRVQFCLLVDQPSVVSPAMAQALKCTSKVNVRHAGSSGNILCSVYASLALNDSLRSLHIDYEVGGTANDSTTSEALTSALCTALKACGRLQSFHLNVHVAHNASELETTPLLVQVFDALKHSPRLRKLSLITPRLTLNIAQQLSALVTQSKTSLVELHIVSIDNMSDAVLGVLHEMIANNVFLSRTSVRCCGWRDMSRANANMDEAKEHNQGQLNKAARFVMNLDGWPATSGDHCALAFDELCCTASLREHLMTLSGKSELQVSLDVKRARCYVQDNYMVFAGIVHAAVLCEAGEGSTQLDELGVHCWRAIVQYLKLSDIVR